jgi:hypothetical protein
MRTKHAFDDAMIEKGQQWVVEASGVEQEYGFGVNFEGLPGEHFEELLEGAEAAGEDEEGVGALAHECFAGVHGVGDVKLGEAVLGDLEIDEDLGDDADNVAACSERSLGDGAHEAYAGAAVDEADTTLGKGAAESLGHLAIDGACAFRRGTEDSDVLNSHGDAIVAGHGVWEVEPKHGEVWVEWVGLDGHASPWRVVG